MSYEGTIRLFWNWPLKRDASFYNLRQHGAFLVSAEIAAGVVTRVVVLSEKGRKCRLQNPWPGWPQQVEHQDGSTQVLRGKVVAFLTEANHHYRISRLAEQNE